MLRNIFALFFRSLRSDSRSLWVHLSWLFLLLVIYLALLAAQEQSRYTGAPGLEFFRIVIYLDLAFVTMLGVSFFSSAISEEKEEDTLGLMTMAGISPLGLLLGKSTTRLFQVFLLLAVQYPFTLLAITLGGLMPDQIYAAYAALLAYTALLANIGLLCSVLARRSRDAAGLTMLWLVGYIFGPLFALAGYSAITTTGDPFWVPWAPVLSPILQLISKTSVFTELYEVTETGYPLQWTPQVISNLAGAVALFVLARILFPFVSHDMSQESTHRMMVPKGAGRFRVLGTGRAWGQALTWKDFHFIAGGWAGILIRCCLYVGLYFLAVAASYPWDQPVGGRHLRWEDVTFGYELFVVPLFIADCAMCASRIFHDEIRHQTLPSLLMLPRNINDVVYSKIWGCLFGLFPGAIAVVASFLVMQGGRRSLYEGIDEPVAWWMGLNLILLVHLCLVISLYLRWGVIATAAALTFGSMMLTTIFADMFLRPISSGRPDDYFVILIFPVVLAIVGCHVAILLRLPALGEK
ncbi:ABC transporter permease [Schlesneria sp. DSM 10557]|uniref:ABC transporter permease n=1 Tax=Schlesneria sp. DSM 10557 TaxID=3044399 RepID=UPI0035A12C8A